MYFKGDILITDPCYIMKREAYKSMPEEYKKLEPKDEDFLVYGFLDKDYPDAIAKNESEYDSHDLSMISLRERLNSFLDADSAKEYIPMKSKMREDLFQKYIEAHRKWKEPYMDDFEKSNYGYNMDVLGFTKYMTHDTLYGDWSCTTYNSNLEPIGNFCADAGLVSVFLLDEVMAYNPDYKPKSHTATIIKDFEGEINMWVFSEIEDENTAPFEYEELRIIGNGNIDFFTTQTGL